MDTHFGDRALNICGDFLQLPPVDTTGSRRSLAVFVDDVGQPLVKDGAEEDTFIQHTKPLRNFESRQERGSLEPIHWDRRSAKP